jgi:16S rRNA (uracil1498-N3)-methyltransferase
MHLFYTPELTPSTSTFTLSEEESKHCIRVLRLAVGSSIVLIDGRGGWYKAEIIDDNAKRCSVQIVDVKIEHEKRSHYLHIAIAPTKNMDRLEWFVEKATEIGIDEISILECKNSERTVVKNERLQKVVVSAIKQSLKAYLPQVNELQNFKKFISTIADFKGHKYIAHCYTNDNKKHLNELYQKAQPVLILIGPEGDFTLEEVKMAEDSGFKQISLGNSRLRTETAALYACTAINIKNE